MLEKYLKVLIVSMIPLIELRGAIPYATYLNLPIIPSYITAIIGNMLPVPFIYFFFRKILIWGSNIKYINKICQWILKKGEKAGKKLEKGGHGTYIALLLFVGIPLPGTGAWTGTLAASILNMDFKKSVASIILGVLLAGIIMLLVSLGVLNII